MSEYAYIHIPFCKRICTYCDFPKVYYVGCDIDTYLKALENEIKTNYREEVLKGIYIGGGSPSSLKIEELEKLFDILSVFKKTEQTEFTIEINPADITLEKLKLFKERGINRLSIGVQSFDESLLKILGRDHDKIKVLSLIREAKLLGFKLNVDLIYGMQEQSLKALENDLFEVCNMVPEHISIYNLIVEEHTILGNQDYKTSEDIDRKYYDYIVSYLEKNGYHRYEISNFSKDGCEAIHNLNYWHNGKYYGFGLGAHGYLDNYRYENTRSLAKYNEGNYLLEKHILTKKEDMDNFIMLGLRKIKGVSLKEFEERFQESLKEIYPIDNLILQNYLKEENGYIFINEDYLFVMNEILLKIFS